MRGLLLLLLGTAGSLGCNDGTPNVWASSPSEPATPAAPERASGATCGRSADCPGGQACVGEVCRHRTTNIRAEALAVAADAQRVAGDPEGALASYEEALGAYAQADVEPPPEVTCGAALLALRYYDSPEHRERGARLADRCFRSSLPGNPQRQEVLRAIVRLRYDGLALASFDAEEPPERFFSQPPSRPTVDAVEISLGFGDGDEPGFTAVREQLVSEQATHIIADCFIQDWELRHQREASTTLVLKLETRMRDMGAYDVYEGHVTLERTGLDVDGFEPCVTSGLSALLEGERPRVARGARWQVPVEISAQL